MNRAVAALLLVLAQALHGSPAGDAARRLVVEGAVGQVGRTVVYDGLYRRLAYPGGDLPVERGSCTDVVIRAYRNAGIDLQRLVHEEMVAAFADYPRQWGLSRPDANIDHRRVPNLAVFFRRQKASLRVTADPRDYEPGDVVVWAIPTPHIGIVSDRRGEGRPLMIHNIGVGAVVEDVLFAYRISDHFRFPA